MFFMDEETVSFYLHAYCKHFRLLSPRTPVSCRHLRQGLRPIKKKGHWPFASKLARAIHLSFFARLKLKCKKTPRCPILPGSCPPSTFSAEGLYFCVRYVNRCFPFAIITRSILRFYSVFGHSKQHKGKECFKSLVRSRPRPISTGQLHTLLHFHLQPIYLVVFQRPYFFRMRYLILRGASCLDAFSTYPFQT